MIFLRGFLAAWLAFNACCYILRIGKPREPLKPGDAVLEVLVTALLIWLLLAR